MGSHPGPIVRCDCCCVLSSAACAGQPVVVATVALVGSAILGLVVFFIAFGIAQENYLSLFTS